MDFAEWKAKKEKVDQVYAKAFEFFANHKRDFSLHGKVIQITPFWDQVYITDDSVIKQLPEGTTEQDYHELFKQLEMSSLEFREVIATMWELHRQHYEWRRQDPNCPEYYEESDWFVEEDESVNS